MASVNKCIFIGNLTRDPEVRYMPNGEAVANCSIAVNESWKDKDGQKQERTEFINLVFYRKLAEIVGKYLVKGRSIYVEGSMRTRKYQDKTGQDRYTTEIVVNEMQMLGGGQGQGDSGQTQQRPAQGQQRPQQRQPKPERYDMGGTPPDFDQDIPF